MITPNPELVKIFAFWGMVLALKVFSILLIVIRQRLQKKVVANPEDLGSLKGGKVLYNDPDVERARRAHLNDLENIPLWYIVTYFWLTTGPSVWLAGMLIRSFVMARIVHTIVYAIVPQQPLRGLSFFVGVSITLYQAISTMLHYS